MNHDPRPHIHRRRRAIGRLRSLTAGVAVAGVAGTAGFGVLAAASWSGSPIGSTDGAGTTTDGTTDSGGANGLNGVTGPSATQAPNRTKVAPNTGGVVQQPAPRVQRGNGTGHASSGGSH